MLTELISGMSLDEALELDRQAVEAALGGLPPRKSHAATLAVSTLRSAIESYRTVGAGQAEEEAS
jgi:NifU-like protein involved in Fe-S cluster formation